MPISFAQAALGADVEVPTLTGRIVVKIPPGTQSGQKLRLRGQGLPDVHGGARGDEFVKVEVEVPRKLTPRMEEILRELAKIEEKNVSNERRSWLDKLKDYLGG